MRDSTLRAFAYVLLGTGLLTLAACGSGGGGDGGGGDGPDLSLYSGEYGHTRFAASGVVPARIVSTRWGRTLSDGAGSCPFDGTLNTSTNVGAASADTSYTLDASRALTHLLSGAPAYSGRLSATGELAVLAAHRAGHRPAIHVDIRRGAPNADADLMGGYRLCSLEYLWGADTARGIVGDLDFNGLGTWTGSYTLNLEGSVTTGVSFSAGAYQVQANGTTRVTYDFGLVNQGQLRQGGDVLSVAGGTQNGSDLYLSVYVRESSGMTAASFAGSYFVSGLEFDYRTGVREWAGIFGTLTADGVGGYTATLRRNMADAVSAPYTETGTYAMGATGRIRLTDGDGVVREGALSADRTFAVYGGGTSPLSWPGIFVLLK